MLQDGDPGEGGRDLEQGRAQRRRGAALPQQVTDLHEVLRGSGRAALDLALGEQLAQRGRVGRQPQQVRRPVAQLMRPELVIRVRHPQRGAARGDPLRAVLRRGERGVEGILDYPPRAIPPDPDLPVLAVIHAVVLLRARAARVQLDRLGVLVLAPGGRAGGACAARRAGDRRRSCGRRRTATGGRRAAVAPCRAGARRPRRRAPSRHRPRAQRRGAGRSRRSRRNGRRTGARISIACRRRYASRCALWLVHASTWPARAPIRQRSGHDVRARRRRRHGR